MEKSFCVQVLWQPGEEECTRAASVLKRPPHTNVQVVGQADSYMAQTFDAVDCVVKQNGKCNVEAASQVACILDCVLL